MPIQSLERFCLERSAKFTEKLVYGDRYVSITMRARGKQRSYQIYNSFRNDLHRDEMVARVRRNLVANFPS